MIERNWLGALVCVPLALALWQGSSCHSYPANSNDNEAHPAANANVNANSNRSKVNNNSKTTPATDLTGTWGGDHISMQVTGSGATIEYDCAHGTISERIAPRSDGHFVVQGSHAAEHGGPTRDNEDQNGQAATYRGSVSGSTMQLTVILSKSNETIGQFTLTQGKNGRIRKCL